MSNYDDRLKDYVDVKERIRLFYEKWPDGRLVTTDIRATSEPDDVPRVWAEAAAYRTPDDPLPGRGWSWLILPGSTPYTRGSEIENAETSAWGRAIGSLGIGIDKSIASGDEVRSKAGEDKREPVRIERDGNGLIGTVEVGQKGKADYELRATPTGYHLAFRLTSERGGIKVEARDALAEDLANSKAEVVGKRVTCWGRIADQEFTPKNATRPVRFQVLMLERISIPGIGEFPSEPSEAPTEPLFSPDEDALIDAAVKGAA